MSQRARQSGSAKGPWMFNLSRFAASRCVQIEGKPRNFSKTCHPCKQDRGVWQTHEYSADVENTSVFPQHYAQEDRQAHMSLTNFGDWITDVELVWQTHHDDNSTTRHMSTMLMVKVPSVLPPRRHTKEDRQAQYPWGIQ